MTINQKQFLESRGRLRVFAAPRATITVGDYNNQYQICQIGFSGDGSISVQCPYFPGKEGILSSPSQDPKNVGPVTYDLNEGGKLTSHLVKLNHHPNGRAHFSQDGKILTQVIRQSFPLATSIGNVFQLSVYHPAAFEPVKRFKKDRLYLPNVFTGPLPKALSVWTEWRRRSAVEANIFPAGLKSGPLTEVVKKSTGGKFMTYFVGQPPGYALRDHVLMVGVEPTLMLDNLTEPTMILVGGFDPHEVAQVGERAPQSGLLTWLYPKPPTPELLKRLGSVDFVPKIT